MKKRPCDDGEVAARTDQAGQGPASFSTEKGRAAHVSAEAVASVSVMFGLTPGDTGPFPTVPALKGARPPSGAVGTSPPTSPRGTRPMFGRGSLVVKRPCQDKLPRWTNGLEGDSGGTAGTFYTGRDRAIEASKAALVRAKDLFAAATAELPSSVEGARLLLAAPTGSLTRSSASRHCLARSTALGVVAHQPPHRGLGVHHPGKKYGISSRPIFRDKVEGKENGKGRGRVPAKRMPKTPGRPPTPLVNRGLDTPVASGRSRRRRRRPLSPSGRRQGVLRPAPG